MDESTQSLGDEEQTLVMVATYRDLSEALLAKGRLEDAGVDCYLADDNVLRMDWFLANALGGIKLKVAASQAHLARELLFGPVEISAEESVPALPQCPRCDSPNVDFVDPDRGFRLAALAAIGLPTPRVGKVHWHCNVCESNWMEDEEEDSQNGPRGEAGSPSSPERP